MHLRCVLGILRRPHTAISPISAPLHAQSNPTLFSTAVDNRSLFSDYYLTRCKRSCAAYTSDWNEATTEEEFIKPVLERLHATLDAHCAFTDALIDQIVYRLYGLTDEVVEGA